MISSFYPQNVIHITVCIFIIGMKASLYWHKMEWHGCLEKSNHCPGCYGTVGHTLDTHSLMTILFYKKWLKQCFLTVCFYIGLNQLERQALSADTCQQ